MIRSEEYRLHRPLTANSALFSPERIATTALVGVLLIILVTLHPFQPPSPEEALVAAKGDPVRQGLLLACFALAGIAALTRRGTGALGLVPPTLWLLLAWCALSVTWAIAPDVSARRLGALFVVTTTVFMCADVLGARRTALVAQRVLAAIIFIDILSILIVPQAVHMSNELDRALVGDWRGMHNHKNNAAVVAVLCLLLSAHFWWERRRPIEVAVICASLIFLIGTGSRTSLAFGLIALLVAFSVRKFGVNRKTVLMFGLPLGLAILLSVVVLPKFLLNVVADPHAFTGRAAVWRVLVNYSIEHPLTGAGFGSFWQIGAASPALDYDRGWAGLSAPHGHNGYLDMLAATGWPGLALGIVALIIAPFLRLRTVESTGMRALFAGCLAYVAMHNMLETSYLTANDEAWIVWLVAAACARVVELRRGGVVQ